jgi:hypothetical protein
MNPQHKGIAPLSIDRIGLVLELVYYITSDTTAIFPLDWGVPNFRRLMSTADNDITDRFLVSEELHSYIVRCICTRQKLLNEIHISKPVKAILTWNEESNGHQGESEVEKKRYRLEPIALDRNVTIDSVEMRVVPLRRRIGESDRSETEEHRLSYCSLVFEYGYSPFVFLRY